MNATQDAAYLAALPPETQELLAAIARRATDMDAEQKGAAAKALGTFALHFAGRPLTDDNELFVPAADMVANVALLVRQAHERATESKEA